MQKSTKAVLLSALVFPGAGHLLLKKYRSAAVLVSVSFTGLYYLISNAIEKGVQIAEAIQSGAVAPDVAAITDLLSKQATGSEAQLVNLATVAVLICWIFGIVDAYRVGRTRDRQGR
jgi:uncharacterized membrane protein